VTSAAKKAKPIFPSGLITNWKSKTSNSASSRKVGKPVKPKLEDAEEPVIGGLNNDDATAVQPDFSICSNLKGQKNDVSQLFVYLNKGVTIFIQTVKIMTDSGSKDEVVVKPRPKPTPGPCYKQVAAPVPASEMAMKVKKELKAVTKVEDDAPIIVASNSDITPLASLDDNLPQFAHSAWASRFLPTLYAFLGSLKNPWELSDPKETDDVKAIQMIIDIVYPCSGYKVKLNDKIYLMVCELSCLL
jgi:hypothetical protein